MDIVQHELKDRGKDATSLRKVEVDTQLEEEVYDAISEFFARYYEDGDFIAKRHYSKQNKYILPYNGEEVYFTWANSDRIM